MVLAAGTKLGPYEIASSLGAGGMGEVYRARDTRLGRDVAVKILPKELSADAARKQRFEREAKTISGLNHPNICVLYDVGSQNGLDYLVMECLEGETLAQRLEKGPLPLEQVLKFGAQIADALDKAHRAGIVHRDLKPGNTMLTATGAKLLDFGLAKPAATLVSGATLTDEARKTTPITQEGTIVGTFQYMSPEQVEGKDLDGRSDIFSLGSVLYEMVTGQRAFQGKSQLSVASAILEREPEPMSAVKPLTPAAFDRAVKKCLAKLPEERWQSASDLASELKWIAESGSHADAPTSAARQTKRERLFLAALAVTAGAAVVLGFLYVKGAPEKARVVQSFIEAMPNSSFPIGGGQGGFAMSPDGLLLAYVAQTSEGKSVLWVRPLDSLQAQPLSGTDGARYPFWSPDSRSIGFFAEGKLKKIEAAGGPPLVLCDAPNPKGGSWNQDGVILFAPRGNGALHRILSSGGTADPVTSLDASKNETTHRWPQFLPDGRHFLYVAGTPLAPRLNPSNAIVLGSFDSRERKFLLQSHSGALYVQGYILFLRVNTLMAQPFDVRRLQFTGDAVPIADSVQEYESSLRSMFSASQNGVLAFLGGASGGNRELIWLDRDGKKVGQVPGLEPYRDPRISPDGKWVAYTLTAPSYDIWSYDLARGMKTRLTFSSGPIQGNLAAVWSPDGRRIAYTSYRGSVLGFHQRSADGSGNEEALFEGAGETKYANDWSPDGRFLAYQQYTQGRYEVWMLSLSGERKAFPFLQSQFHQGMSAFSPDGKWLAYCSSESGERKVYVVPFPGPGGKWQVSPGSGCYPRWRHDEKELFYLSLADNKIMAAAVSTSGSSFTITAVTPLFETPAYTTDIGAFDVTADGKRFIVVNEPGQPNTAITLVENWDAELKKR